MKNKYYSVESVSIDGQVKRQTFSNKKDANVVFNKNNTLGRVWLYQHDKERPHMQPSLKFKINK